MRPKGIDMEKTAPPEPYRPGRAALQGLLDLRPRRGLEVAAVSVEDAVARGLAVAQVYAFASVDYPGAAGSLVLDSDGTTAVGAFDFDPSIDRTTAFTFGGGVYQILTVPGSAPFSVATGINGAGLIVGLYFDLANVLRGFANNGGIFSNVDFPGASGTQVIGVNDAGQMVGDYFDGTGEHGFVSDSGTFTTIDFPGATATAAAGINAAGDVVGGYSDATGTHGFLLQAGVFTPINFPLATSTTAFGINDTGEIAGFYSDAAGKEHGFIYAGGAFSTVDVAGARATLLTRIKNGGAVTGICTDALNEQHGITGQ